MYPATVVSTLPPIYHLDVLYFGHFCVASSNTSFEIESRIRAAVNNM